MSLLSARLYDAQQNAARRERRAQPGGIGDRSERIRTTITPRVASDHRINLTWDCLNEVMKGIWTKCWEHCWPSIRPSAGCPERAVTCASIFCGRLVAVGIVLCRPG